MRIDHINLRNYRCFENLDIDFHDRMTVIVGTNGSGKTSVLEGTVVALGTFFSEMDGIRDVSLAKRDVRLKAYAMGEADDVQLQYPVSITASGNVGDQTVTWNRSLNGNGRRTTKKEAKELTEISARYQKRLRDGDKQIVLPLIAYYGTGRLWDYHRIKKTDIFKENSKTNGYIDSLSGTANIKLMMSWFRKKTVQMAQMSTNWKGNGTLLSVVYGAMEECYKRITGLSKISILYNLDTNELDCHYSDEEGKHMSIPLSQLSDGYKGTISLIADIAYRMAVLNPQLGEKVIKDTDGIVLIDEVDLHLHPAWQHRILGDLQSIFPRIQFIVTTHAPAVISTAKSENLVILQGYTAVDAGSETYGNDVNSILNEIMGVTERIPVVSDLFKQFYALLDEKKYAEAEKVLDEIDLQRDYHDKEVAASRVKLKLERIRGGRND